jgi:hypothetical protein
MKRPTPTKPRTPKKSRASVKLRQARKHVTVKESLHRLDGPRSPFALMSKTRPNGHFNEWPVQDKNAFVAFLHLVMPLMQLNKDPVPVCEFVSCHLGLPYGIRHWLVQSVLSDVFHEFYVWSADFYGTAEQFLDYATEEDLDVAGVEAMVWAVRLARLERH